MKTRRHLYSLRAFVPGLAERHQLEAMVGPLGFWEELQEYHLRLLRANGLRPEHVLLDVGCGPLQGGLEFIHYLNQGGYVGVDIDPKRVNVAWAQVARHSLGAKNPSVVLSSSFGDGELADRRFDFIWASQMLYYLNDTEMVILLGMVRRRLQPNGKFLGDTFDPNHYEFTHPENPRRYVRHTESSLAVLAAGQGLAVRRLGTIGDFGYPKRLTLRTNPLFEFTHAKPVTAAD